MDSKTENKQQLLSDNFLGQLKQNYEKLQAKNKK